MSKAKELKEAAKTKTLIRPIYIFEEEQLRAFAEAVIGDYLCSLPWIDNLNDDDLKYIEQFITKFFEEDEP
jgi:hypothetical protein